MLVGDTTPLPSRPIRNPAHVTLHYERLQGATPSAPRRAIAAPTMPRCVNPFRYPHPAMANVALTEATKRAGNTGCNGLRSCRNM